MGLLSAAEGTQVTSVVRSDPKSGRLVRSVVVKPVFVTPKAVTPQHVTEPARTQPPALAEAVEQIAAKHELPPQLIHSVIKVESNYNPFAVSSKGALGLMQLIPSTARRFGVADVFNPMQNIEGGAKYLRYLLDLYGNSYPLALAAYNAGEGAVAKYGGVPPYQETRNYVAQVRKQLERRKQEMKPVEKKAPPDQPAAPAHILELREPDGTVRYVSQ